MSDGFNVQLSHEYPSKSIITLDDKVMADIKTLIAQKMELEEKDIFSIQIMKFDIAVNYGVEGKYKYPIYWKGNTINCNSSKEESKPNEAPKLKTKWTFYESAQDHYGRITTVHCDYCFKTITSCYGTGSSTDLCETCYKDLNNGENFKPNPPPLQTNVCGGNGYR